MKFESSGDFKCLECAERYFSDELGNCEVAVPEISNCLLYENNDFCLKCKENFTLS